MKKLTLTGLLSITLLLTGCGDDATTSTTTSVTFPDLTTISEASAPKLSGTSQSSSRFLENPRIFPVTYATASEWSTYDAAGALRDVLGSVDETPAPVTRMLVLLNSAESSVEGVASSYYNTDGTTKDCTAIASGTSITTPFFNGSVSPFFTFSDTDAYNCYVSTDTSTTLFGRIAVTDPPAGCTDAFTYNFMEGSLSTETNTSSTDTRGDSVTLNQILKFQYNGCTQDIKLIYAHSTYYPDAENDANHLFTSRTELTGNSGTHTFKMRVLKYDGYKNGSYIWFTSAAAGTVLTDSGTSHFVIDYVKYDGSQTEVQTSRSFCIQSSSTVGSYTAVAGSNCETSTAETDYETITAFTYDDIHNTEGTETFAITTTAFGL